jgi:hypothetical protein
MPSPTNITNVRTDRGHIAAQITEQALNLYLALPEGPMRPPSTSTAMTNRPAPPPARTHAPTPPSIAGTVTAAKSAQTPSAAAMTAAMTSGDVRGATAERYRRARPPLTICWRPGLLPVVLDDFAGAQLRLVRVPPGVA